MILTCKNSIKDKLFAILFIQLLSFRFVFLIDCISVRRLTYARLHYRSVRSTC